ncbi:hypothetical protein SAZ11_62420 [Streptomyces sp. FXJ1.4098]|uniref:hypothetical protein n=1 Tax=Streptomyces sp. NPDC020845 TaxID=3365096 RepID=UPI00299B9220|nr:hypothetical protein [Streptomyces sp. FXJ1.4098]
MQRPDGAWYALGDYNADAALLRHSRLRTVPQPGRRAPAPADARRAIAERQQPCPD